MFRVGVTRDFLKPDDTIGFGDIGLSQFASAGVEWEFLPSLIAEILPDYAQTYDGLLVEAPRVTAQTLRSANRLKIVVRFGVGHDNVDVGTCTQAGVLLTITPDGVRRPVAVAALTLVLALSHKLLNKDRLNRSGRWAEKLNSIGQGSVVARQVDQLRALRDGALAETNAADNLRTMRLLSATYESAQTGRAIFLEELDTDLGSEQ
jgi:D-3-phosphoglycerate dehydrogenase